MSFLRKLARRKAPQSLPGPSSQEGTTDLGTFDDIAVHGLLTELPSADGQLLTVQRAHPVPDRSGHRYDKVQIGGESRNHLGDVYTKNVTYNYGAPFLPHGSREKRLAHENQRLEFLKALKFDTMASRLATIGPAHSDTCAWIVQTPEYVRWRNEGYRSEHHGVLWIKGKPGSGKSTLMKYALSNAQKRADGDIIVSFFFNARGQSLERSSEGMYRSLVYQLLSKLPHLYSDQNHVKQQMWSVETLEIMFQTSVLALEPDYHVVLYIDALDECTQAEVRDVVGRFEDLVNLTVARGLRFSVCLSSRHYPHITMHKFEGLTLDDRKEHLEDISSYVYSNVARLSIPTSAKSKIEVDIKRRSSGIFLWAVLVIKILREKRDDGASLTELTSSLAAVPDKLGSLFANILANSDKDTIMAFQWVLYARYPLSLHELYFAMKTSTNQISTGEWDRDDVDRESIVRFIMRSTRGLVEAVQSRLRSGHWTVQFIHESVREYLLHGGSASLDIGDPHLIESLAHAEIAACCLSYIQLDSPKYLQYFEPYRTLSWFSSETFPLLDYATGSLFYHADLAYRGGALSLTFLSELPLRLLLSCENLLPVHREFPLPESTTILFLLLVKQGHALAEALLAGCSKAKQPGAVVLGMAAQPAITSDINIRCNEQYGNILGVAAAYDQIQVMQQLLRLGAEVVPSERYVCSPLIPAIVWGSKDGVELLLKNGADANAVDNAQPPNTALMVALIAFRKGNEDIVELLLQHGADANAMNNFVSRETALSYAVGRNLHQVVLVLLAYGAAKNKGAYSLALDVAFDLRHTKIARLLWDAQFSKANETEPTLRAQVRSKSTGTTL